MSVIGKYEERARAVHSMVCVGLDSNIDRLPDRFKQHEHPQFAFNQHIIQQTHPYVSAYKPNIAFYESRGPQGLHELKLTMDYLRAEHPEILTICDAKRGDIDSTSEQYAAAIFDWLGFDAVTLQPYLGRDAIQPFLDRDDKGCIILCRTSNPGSGEIQDLRIKKRGGKRLWQVIAEQVRDEWNASNNCMLVVGATYPEELKEVRELVGEMTLLIPGVGAQGGDVGETVRAGMNNDGLGMIINSSRGIIFADNPSGAAGELRDAINMLA